MRWSRGLQVCVRPAGGPGEKEPWATTHSVSRPPELFSLTVFPVATSVLFQPTELQREKLWPK